MTPQLLRILLVEDNPADSRLISEYLKEAKNCRFELVYADRLSAGLKILAQGKVDLVLLDLNLPDSTGFDTFTKMQTTMPQIAVVVLTGLADEKMAVQAVREGAQDYLIKSTLDGSLLSRAIRYAIERHRLAESVRERTRELQEMENRYRTLFNAASDAIFFNDLEGRLLEVNDEAGRLLGYTQEELLHLTGRDITSPEYFARRSDVLEQLRGTDHLVFETELVTRDGRIIPTECSSRLIEFLDRPAVLSIVRDISKRKAAEEALVKNYRELQETAQQFEQSRNMLQLIIESVPVRIFWKDGDLRFIGCNTLFARDAGFSHPQQLLGKDDFAMSWREQADLYRTDDRQVMESLCPKMNIIEPQTTPTGANIWLSTSKVPLQIPNGEVFGVLGIYEDVTDRKLAEEALRESEELYRSLFENMLNGFAYCKMVFEQNQPQDFVYLAVNSSFEALTGLKNVVGKKVSEVIPGIGESDQELLKIYGRVALTGKPERFETYVEALKMWFSLSVYSPEKEYFVAVFDVITERKRTEEALKESLARTTEVQYGTIQALATVTEARDPYTAGHQRRVTQLACAVARELGLSADQVAGLRVMGLLHDLGKISIPAEILSKPGKLSDTEFGLIKSHTKAGYEIVKEIRFPWPVAEVILQHHERLDGSGYPQGLTGPDITLEARILAVADVVEAMSSYRPYRPALGLDQALEEIAQKKGILYDPEVVDACIKVCTEDKFTFE